MSEIIFTGKSINEYLARTRVTESDEISTPKGRTSRELINNLISEMEKNSNYKNEFYKSVLRAFLSQIKLFHYNEDGEIVDVLLHHGRPDRLTAKKFYENNIVLPYSTISLVRVEKDDKKGRTNDMFVDYSWWNVDTNRAERIVSRPEVPVRLTYSLNLWTKYISHMEALAESVRRNFNPALLLKLPQTPIAKAYLSNETDLSKLEVADKEDRVVQKSFGITLEAFIPSRKFKITSTGKIEEFNAEIGFDEKVD